MTIKEFEIQNALGSLSFVTKQELAYDKYTPKKILTILSTDENLYVRCYVATNTNAPVEVLKKLLKDKDEWTRNWAQRTLLKLQEKKL